MAAFASYPETTGTKSDLKDGVLLEAGFDTVAPNIARDIGSWTYDSASSRVDIIDDRAMAVPCYEAGYTLVEKLQTISTKYRKQQETGQFPANFLRHYYDVYCLLGDNPDIVGNPAFSLIDPKILPVNESAYEGNAEL